MGPLLGAAELSWHEHQFLRARFLSHRQIVNNSDRQALRAREATSLESCGHVVPVFFPRFVFSGLGRVADFRVLARLGADDSTGFGRIRWRRELPTGGVWLPGAVARPRCLAAGVSVGKRGGLHQPFGGVSRCGSQAAERAGSMP